MRPPRRLLSAPFFHSLAGWGRCPAQIPCKLLPCQKIVRDLFIEPVYMLRAGVLQAELERIALEQLAELSAGETKSVKINKLATTPEWRNWQTRGLKTQWYLARQLPDSSTHHISHSPPSQVVKE